MTKKAWIVIAAALGCAGGADKQVESAAVMVEITTPATGDTVTNPVRVELRASGVEIVPAADERPGTGHHHLYVDRDVASFTDTMPRGTTGLLHLGSGQTEFTLDSLAPGQHRVIAVIGDWQHRSLAPPAADTVTFVVRD
jgi:hypothetical protein